MTEEDVRRYTNAVKEYERKKNRFFVFPHDDRTFLSYLIPENEIGLLVVAIAVIVGAILFAGIVFVIGLFKGTD